MKNYIYLLLIEKNLHTMQQIVQKKYKFVKFQPVAVVQPCAKGFQFVVKIQICKNIYSHIMFSLYNMCLNIAGKCATAITRRYSQMSIEVRTFVSFLKNKNSKKCALTNSTYFGQIRCVSRQ